MTTLHKAHMRLLVVGSLSGATAAALMQADIQAKAVEPESQPRLKSLNRPGLRHLGKQKAQWKQETIGRKRK